MSAAIMPFLGIIMGFIQLLFVITSGIVIAPLFQWAWNKFAVTVFNLKSISFLEAFAGVIIIGLIIPNSMFNIDGNKLLGMM